MYLPYHQLPSNAKVWIYQADRNFSTEEVASITMLIENFVQNWQSHQVDVPAYGALYYRRFVVLLANHDEVNISGCSIDSSVKFIKELESVYGVGFFDRMKICYKIQEQLVGSINFNQIEEKIQEGKLNENTIVFNNLVQTKDELEGKWEIALKDSFFSKYLLQKSN